MKIIKISLIIIFECLLLSCKTEQKKEEQKNTPSTYFIHTIDLSYNLSELICTNLLLSDIVEYVEYIPLETTNDCLIGHRTFYALTNEDIYVLNRNYTNEEIFRFDRKTGKFIKQIGRRGQGPQDMLYPSALYAANVLIYASSNVSNKVYIYHKDGKHIRTISFGKGTGERISVIQDKYIIRHPGRIYMEDENNYKEGNPNQFLAATLFDMEGNALITKCDTLIGEGLPSISLDWDPRRWYYNNQLNFYNEVDATVYAVDEKGIIPRYRFKLDKNRWIVTGKITKEYIKYIKFHKFHETSDMILTLAVDFQKEEYYIYQSLQNLKKIQVYDFSGKWQRSLKVPKEISYQELFNYNEQYLIGINSFADNYNPDNLPMDTTPYHLIDKYTGERHPLPVSIKKWISKTLERKKIEIDKNTLTRETKRIFLLPRLWANGYDFFISEFSKDTLYRYKNDQLTPFAIRYPSIDSYEIPVVISPTFYTDNYFFFKPVEMKLVENNTMEPYNKAPLLMWNRKSDEIRHITYIYDGNRPIRSLWTNMYKEWSETPNYIFNNFPASKLCEEYEAGKLKGKLKEVASRLKEDDNDVIAIYKLKE